MFGYGSILNSASRKQTSESGTVIPVKLAGIRRYWSIDTDWDVTSVGVKKEIGASVNGILVEVSAETLEKYKKRESHYQIQNIDTHG